MDIPKNFKITYLALGAPFILAFLSWLYFPAIAQSIITGIFNYSTVEQAANAIWYGMVRFFYTWYTFVAIGVAGTWVVAAVLGRKRHVGKKNQFLLMQYF